MAATTLTAGSIYTYLVNSSGRMTLTPGGGGTITILSRDSSDDTAVPRSISAAETLPLRASSTISFQAVGVDATWEFFPFDSAENMAWVQSSVSGAGKSQAASQRVYSRVPTGISSNISVSTQTQAKAPFYGVVLRYENLSTAPYTISAASVAPVATDLSDGTGATFSPVTFGGNSTAVVAAASGTTDNAVPTIVESDVIYVSSLNSLYLSQQRTFYAAAASGINGTATWIANQRSLCNRLIASKVDGGDKVTGSPTVAVAAAGTWWAPQSVRYLYTVPSITIGACGDSLMVGFSSTDDMLGPVDVAVRLKSSDTLVYEAEVRAISSQTHTASYKTGIAMLASNYPPDYLIFSGWSPNDGTTQAAFDRSFAEALDLIDRCKSAGVTPIITTTGPQNGLSAPDKARLDANNLRVKALASASVLVSDWDAVVNDGTGNIVAAYNSGDNVHYSTAGYAAIGAALATILP